MAVSVLLAVLASYTALELAGRVATSSGRARHTWILGGAVAMGLGIWSMHFTAMLAYTLPVPLQHAIPLWVLSIVIAIVVSGCALALVSRERVGPIALVTAGVCMGAAIAGMHYTGMAAVRVPGTLHYDRLLVAVSVAIAVTAATAALWLLVYFRHRQTRRARWGKLGSAGVMGLAIAGMHYTGMAAVRFTPGVSPTHLSGNHLLPTAGLAPAVIIGAAALLSMTLLLALVDGHLRARRRETDMLQASEARLQQSEAYFRALIDNASDLITLLDGNGRIRYEGPAVSRILGYTSEELVGRDVLDLIHPEDRPAVATAFNHTLDSSRDRFTVEYRFRHRDGSWRSLESRGTNQLADPVVAGIVINSRDITERKQAEEEILKAKEMADAANRAKSEFLSSMSHELRTPLNSVIGFANVLGKNKLGNLRPQDLVYLQRIQSNGKHLLGLINDILDLSKIEAGKMALEPATFALGSLVAETVSELQGGTRPGVELLAEIPEDIAPLRTDPAKLKQVLINLVGNALKFTESGSVRVRLKVDSQTGRPTRIDVVDTGIGVPAARLSAIFQAFEQAESGTARRFGGTGLGLAISSSLAQFLGFRLEVQSEPGAGSTFSIVLFEAEPAMSSPDVSQEAFAPILVASPGGEELFGFGGKLVLVVDDEIDSRVLLTQQIEELGFSVITASSGEQALRMAREFRPDLITLDLLLPGMSGREILRTLKADPELCEIPVLVVSVVAEENRGSVLGAVDLVEKPIQRAPLLAVLRRHLGLAPGRVLVVDDDPDARLLLTTYLCEAGANVRVAENGRAALRALENFHPDLVVLDLFMPEMDGIELLHALRRMPSYKHAPVIVVTGKDLSPDELQHLSARADAVLQKGGDLQEDLKAVIQRIWYQKQQFIVAPSARNESEVAHQAV